MFLNTLNDSKGVISQSKSKDFRAGFSIESAPRILGLSMPGVTPSIVRVRTLKTFSIPFHLRARIIREG